MTGTDLQIGAGGLGRFYGPHLVDGNVRVRHAMTGSLLVEGETGAMRVVNDGEAGSRNAYTGRGGMMLRTTNPGGAQAAASIGLGGGWSRVAGTWGSLDIGGSLIGRPLFESKTFSHSNLSARPVEITQHLGRPLLAMDASYNQPFGDHPFLVTDTDGHATALHLTQNVTVTTTLGLELGDSATSFVIGLSGIYVVAGSNGVIEAVPDRASADTMFVVASAAIRTAID
ncbi:MAG: hypothetical protein JWO36_2004 [Myxococcales bacterium]|nr:hypothetical protein [Myxococcales bacterium]